jgi:hypothetical protein
MIEILNLINYLIIIYISLINNNYEYNFIIFNLFKNIFIKSLIIFIIFLSANFYYIFNNKIYLNTSILLAIFYVLINEYYNMYKLKNNLALI